MKWPKLLVYWLTNRDHDSIGTEFEFGSDYLNLNKNVLSIMKKFVKLFGSDKYFYTQMKKDHLISLKGYQFDKKSSIHVYHFGNYLL